MEEKYKVILSEEKSGDILFLLYPHFLFIAVVSIKQIANLVGSTQKTKVTVIFNYQSTTGINIIQTNKVKVYSTKEFLILRCPVLSAKSITIYDVSGKIIAHYNLYGSLDEYTLPKVEKKGLYLFSVNMIDGKKIAGKFFSYAK